MNRALLNEQRQLCESRSRVETLEPRQLLAAASYGVAQMAAFDTLPYLNLDRFAGGQSSRDRTGGNEDWGHHLRVEGDSDYVILDNRGAGVVDRLWFTRVTDSARIKMWFDGESTPRVNLKIADMANGLDPRFPAPLAAGPADSSGGFVSYVPLPYASRLKIAVSGADDLYYNVGYETFAPGTAVMTWTGSEDTSAVRDLWNHLGKDPKSTAGNTVVTGTTNLAANGATTLLDLNGGAREIESIKLSVPGVSVPALQQVTDNGRAHSGSSEFSISITNAGSGPVTLSRRFDYGVGNQKANVYVDGTLIGQWFDPGSDNANHWRDSTFALPASATAGKSTIRVKIEFVSSDIDWNEFRYQAIVNSTVTDTLDVGNAASEQTHGYVITNENWSGTRTFTYPPALNDSREILNSTRLRITWDNQSTPAVDAPLGSFFAMGQFGAANVQSLPLGIDAAGRLYAYFPMPFRNHAKIELVNDRGVPLNGLTFEIQHKAFSGSFAEVGYFRTQFHQQLPTQVGSDVLILDTPGAGKFLGVTQSIAGPADASASRWYLEGDERIYVDGSATPVIQGTGTEDFYDGAWYFENGPYSNALSGNSTHQVMSKSNGTYSDETAAYRLYLHNAVPFRNDIRVSIEHGATNDVAAEEWTLAYYYQSELPRAGLTDVFDVGNAASESAHQYAIDNATWSGSRSFTYEGDFDDVTIDDDGRAHKGSSAFTMAIDPANVGVILRRRFDQGIADQRVNVLVNGQFVGTWYQAGANDSHRWADDDFFIPASFTGGKASVRVQLNFVSSANDFNEFRYQALSVLPADVTAPVANASFEFQTRHAVNVVFSEPLGDPLGGIVVQNLTTGATLPPSAYSIVPTGANTASIRFAGVLADGNYQFVIPGTSATDVAGNPLAMDFTSDFYVLSGDADRNRQVDFADLVILAQHYNQSGQTFATGDFTYDGKVDFQDLVALAQRYNTSLTGPPVSISSRTPLVRAGRVAREVLV